MDLPTKHPLILIKGWVDFLYNQKFQQKAQVAKQGAVNELKGKKRKHTRSRNNDRQQRSSIKTLLRQLEMVSGKTEPSWSSSC